MTPRSQKILGSGTAQWWEHLPTTNVAWVRFLDLTSDVGWVCCWLLPLLQDVFLWVLWFSTLLTGSGRVFLGSGIWPKYGAGFGKKKNILMGFGIWLLPGKWDSPKFGHGMQDFVACLSGIREIITTQINVVAAKANQPGERKISIERANLHLKFISFCRN